jgi:hypothetical protein
MLHDADWQAARLTFEGGPGAGQDSETRGCAAVQRSLAVGYILIQSVG